MRGKHAGLACRLPLQTVTLASVVASPHGRVRQCKRRLYYAVLYTGNTSGSRTANTPHVTTQSSKVRQKSKTVVVQVFPYYIPILSYNNSSSDIPLPRKTFISHPCALSSPPRNRDSGSVLQLSCPPGVDSLLEHHSLCRRTSLG